jgi:hypothetical protein
VVAAQSFGAESIVLADALLHVAALDELCGLRRRAPRLTGANQTWHAAHGGERSLWEPALRSPLQNGLVPPPQMPTDPALLRARTEGRAVTLDEATTSALDNILCAGNHRLRTALNRLTHALGTGTPTVTDSPARQSVSLWRR